MSVSVNRLFLISNKCAHSQLPSAAWIDIGLVVTPETVPILFTLLQHTESSLRVAAAETLLEVISKGMKPADKVELLRVLNLTATIGELERSTRLAKGEETQDDSEVEFRERLAKLANGVAHELSRVVDETAAEDVTRAAADDMLIVHMSLILELLSDRYDELAEAVLPSVTTVLVIYKKLKRRANSGQGNNAIFTNEKALFLSRLLDIVLAKMRFDDSAEWNGGGPQSANSDEEDSEDEDVAKFLQLRKALQTVAASIAQMDMGLFAGRIQALIIEVLVATDASLAGSGPAVPWQTVEHALFCTYFFGEVLANAQASIKTGMNATSFVHLPPDMPKAQKSKVHNINFVDLTLNPLGETVLRFYQSSVSAYRHAAVQIQYFECAVRYSAFFTVRPDALGPVLQPFLDWRGIHHERPVVRHRVQYLFSRFVRETRDCITPDYVAGILEATQDVLVVEAHMPAAKPDEDPLLNAVNSPSAFDSQLNLFEMCGVLLSLLNNQPDRQAALLRALVDPSLQKMKRAVEAWSSNKDNLELVLETHHLFLALSNLAKGFPDQSSGNTSRQAPPWMLVFKDVTEQILTSLTALNRFQIIRDAARGAFARIVATAGLVVLPYIPNLLNSLLGEVSSPELCDFLSFLGLISTKYKALTELCSLAKTMYQKRGNELLEYLTNVYLPNMQCPPDVAQEFAQNLKRLDAKELRKALEVSHELFRDAPIVPG
ncbi:hypothetical protein L7F22_041646 [Adiantum nelumboides]|nr:hypothetical protein [Adiantum nelumboides]